MPPGMGAAKFGGTTLLSGPGPQTPQEEKELRPPWPPNAASFLTSAAGHHWAP